MPQIVCADAIPGVDGENVCTVLQTSRRARLLWEQVSEKAALQMGKHPLGSSRLYFGCSHDLAVAPPLFPIFEVCP